MTGHPPARTGRDSVADDRANDMVGTADLPIQPKDGGQSEVDPSRDAPQPNDRDESTSDMSGPPDEAVRLAKADLDAGRKDTSRAVEANDTYQRQKE